MAEITTTSSENKTMQETVLVDGMAAYSLSANVNGGRAGGFSISGTPQNESTYQANKEEIEPVIQDFVTEVLAQAQAQESVDTTATSEASTTKTSKKASK